MLILSQSKQSFRPLFCLLTLTAVALVACTSGISVTPPTHTASPRPQLTWMIAVSGLKSVEQTDPSGKLAQTHFDNANTYLLGANARNFPAGWKSTPTASFRSYADLKRAFDSHSIDPIVKAVVYDSESWSFTPPQEQKDPALYYKLAAQIVHSHHLIFIATPATDLAQVIHPVTTNRYENFLKQGIAGAAAQYADVYELQAQGAEMNLSTFAQFVRRAAAQARAKNPQVKVLAGLSTNPSGQHVTGDELYHAVEATKNSVSGYWLNIPEGGEACPKCGTAQPQVAVDLLNKLG